MNILFALKNMNEATGGAERVLATVASGLCEKGHRVTLVTFDPPGGQSHYPLHNNIKRIDLGIGNVNNRTTPLEMLKRISALRATIKSENPDIAVGFMHSMFVPLSFAAIGTKTPIISSEHTVPAHYKTRPFEFLLLRLSAFFANCLTVLSETIKNTYPDHIRQKMHVIPNPVQQSPKSFEDIQAIRNDTVRKIILNVGRLDQGKDHATLIRAFSTLAKKYPDWDVHIYGGGALQNNLNALIASLNMQNRIMLKGTTQQISHAYEHAEIFASPSYYESFGLAAAEAMAHACPVIAFQSCPGLNELIEDGENGLLISSYTQGRDEALAKALTTLIDNPALRKRMGQTGVETATAFAPEHIITLWEKFLKKWSE